MSQTYAKIKGGFGIDEIILPDSIDGDELKGYKFVFEPYDMVMEVLKEISDDYYGREFRESIVNFEDFLDSIHYGKSEEDVKDDFASLVMETVGNYIAKGKLEIESVDFSLEPNSSGGTLDYRFEVTVNVDMDELWWPFQERNWFRFA